MSSKLAERVTDAVFVASVCVAMVAAATCFAVFIGVSTYRYVIDGPLVSVECTEMTVYNGCYTWKRK